MSASLVIVNLLLAPSCSSASQHRALCEALDAIGLTERTEGRASFTVRVTPARFEKLFGTRAAPVPARAPSGPPGPSDRGTRVGYVCGREPAVPAVLAEFVTSVGVEPPITHF